MIPIFNVVLISDNGKNAINNGNLFHLPKKSDKLCGNIVYKMQIEMSSLMQVQASYVLTAISEF